MGERCGSQNEILFLRKRVNRFYAFRTNAKYLARQSREHDSESPRYLSVKISVDEQIADDGNVKIVRKLTTIKENVADETKEIEPRNVLLTNDDERVVSNRTARKESAETEILRPSLDDNKRRVRYSRKTKKRNNNANKKCT